MKKKYPKTTGYWVYVHRTPDNMYYVGQSNQQICERWKPSQYRTMSLHPYIQKNGWDNIEHLVVKDGLTKEQAVYWEERFRQMYTEMGCGINQRRSGDCTVDLNEYMREYNQKRLSTPEGCIYNRVASYNHYHTPIETPMEAKQKYLETGYIPSYIKKDDLF